MSFLITTLHGYEIHLTTSGGQAGRGHNRTASLQVRHNGMIVKTVRFVADDLADRAKATDKVRSWIAAEAQKAAT